MSIEIPDCLRNLVWENGEMYYVDDNGMRIEKPIDLQIVQNAMITQMRESAPKKPLVLNGQEVDREELLKELVKNDDSNSA